MYLKQTNHSFFKIMTKIFNANRTLLIDQAAVTSNGELIFRWVKIVNPAKISSTKAEWKEQGRRRWTINACNKDGNITHINIGGLKTCRNFTKDFFIDLDITKLILTSYIGTYEILIEPPITDIRTIEYKDHWSDGEPDEDEFGENIIDENPLTLEDIFKII